MATAIELVHVSHYDPLILIDDFDSSSIAAPVECCVCDTSIIGLSPAYKCSLEDSPCSFFLHKRCAESPERVTNFMHPQHQLHLRDCNYYARYKEATYFLEVVKISCATCSREISDKTWAYNCNLCELDWNEEKSAASYPFALCARCVVMESMLDHEGHQHHSLTLLRRRACFCCDACGIESTELNSYICYTCQFWIHSSCAAYPRTIKLRIHEEDTLQLIYSIPDMYRRFIRHCPICSEGIEQKNWAYFCEEPGYFVHIKCAAALLASGKNMIQIEDDDDDEQAYSDLMQFPLPRTESLMENLIAVHRSGNLTPQRNAEQDEVDNGKESPVINHWRHPNHKLFLLEEIENADNSDDDDDESDSKKRIDEMLVCDGCVQPISTASNKRYYGCIGCNFFLHTTCANHLPLRSGRGRCPRHPEHILRLHNFEPGPLNYITCGGCDAYTNGFFYGCSSWRCLRISVCILCSLTPHKIKHEYHKHPLVLRRATSEKTCNACLQKICSKFEYGCESCSDIQIHPSCVVSFPKTIHHRWESHSISLIYPPIYYKGLRYCEICELEVNPEAWLYRCSECDHCFHPLCIRQPHHMKLGNIIDPLALHPHPLTLKMIYKSRYPQRQHKSLSCSERLCRSIIKKPEHQELFLECAGCNFIICVPCFDRGTLEERFRRLHP